MRLYLVRHGQTSWNVDGKAQGHTDISLDDSGLAQAYAVGEAFRGIEIDRIVSSDLQRAFQTAEAIQAATNAPAERRRDLRERSFGDWEGMDFRDLAATQIELGLQQGVSFTEVRPPNGESFADVWTRLDPFMDAIEESDERIAVVTHGGTCAVLLARLMRANVDSIRSFRFGNTAVTELERRADGFYLLVRYADTSHLADARALTGSVDGSRR
ncbi:histidine phosphatase family protein [Fimbriimonas ginsengisoli]|uniref:Putative alpha-ribazole phosphatase n=1 Tax=Fimbriimonas ginsengisoli Gsoil 348 TaxID=661478 RepID=A0A068NIW3_FIMGI|nr:histidine phosphatase family protein [Fimbriimonas ginsengisoli]AIE83461.1 putative alpha-ribazole phosphatase [Fimbriimonas ginsengisoli Gsoil 348]